MIPFEWLKAATNRLEEGIQGTKTIQRTPLTYDERLNIYLKWENHQVTGSFKVRGAFNKVMTLHPSEKERGLVTASAGNHGQGVALAAQHLGIEVVIFASENAVPSKITAMRNLGADVQLVKGGYEEAEQTALQYVKKTSRTWISPYNDPQVIAGQGTIGTEIMQQLNTRPCELILAPAGGGGLACGIGLALEAWKMDTAEPTPKLVAVQSKASAFLHQLFHQGTQDYVIEASSLADGLSGAVEEGSVTIPLARHYLDDFVLVDENDIETAIAYAWYHYKEVIEGSAAVTLAAFLTNTISTNPAVLIITGGNILPEEHQRIIDLHKE